jgi:outer membrane receptor protein involved in Fe transport
LSYDYKGFNTRVSLNYNGSYLNEVGEEAADDIYINDRLQVDLTAQYTITPRWRVFVEMLNLTDAPFEEYQGSEDQIIQREFYSWWSRFGIKFDM